MGVLSLVSYIVTILVENDGKLLGNNREKPRRYNKNEGI